MIDWLNAASSPSEPAEGGGGFGLVRLVNKVSERKFFVSPEEIFWICLWCLRMMFLCDVRCIVM